MYKRVRVFAFSIRTLMFDIYSSLTMVSSLALSSAAISSAPYAESLSPKAGMSLADRFRLLSARAKEAGDAVSPTHSLTLKY